MNDRNKTCCLYIRVSSDGQNLENQRPDLLKAARDRGLEVVAVFEAALGRRLRIEQHRARLRAVERPSLVADNGKLSRATGWTPRVTLEAGIAELVNGLRPLRG